jgi:heavy metal efflux system protein
MGDVQGFLATALAGKAVGTLWDGERNFDIALRLPSSARETVEQLRSLQIPTPRGSLVALSAVADIDSAAGLSAISREDGRRYVGVRMNVRSRDLGSFVNDARAAVDKAVAKRSGMQFVWAGEIESKERALDRLKLVVPVALLITLILLYVSFNSLPLALLVLFNVPFVAIGGAAGLWLMDMPLSISACVGFIALVGQASLNGVLIVSAIEERRKRGESLELAIAGGTAERLRAVLMTSLLAALGLIPAVLSRSMGAEMQRPIAVVIVGGTISAALLTLFVLPVVYKIAAPFLAKAEAVDDGPVAEDAA